MAFLFRENKQIIPMALGVAGFGLFFAILFNDPSSANAPEDNARSERTAYDPPERAFHPPPEDEAIFGKVKHSGWVVPHGEEFWNSPAVDPEAEAGSGGGLDLSAVIDRVRHAIDERPGGIGEMIGDSYSVRFGGEGTVFNPASSTRNRIVSEEERPESGGSEVHFRTASIRAGGQVLFEESAGEWLFKGNTAQRLLHSGYGLVEH
jgi:hypothetical protein